MDGFEKGVIARFCYLSGNQPFVMIKLCNKDFFSRGLQSAVSGNRVVPLAGE